MLHIAQSPQQGWLGLRHETSYTVGDRVPTARPRPAFRRLQYGKAGRAWYLFSREHDVIGKLQNLPN